VSSCLFTSREEEAGAKEVSVENIVAMLVEGVKAGISKLSLIWLLFS
jgi:hypothetical protein